MSRRDDVRHGLSLMVTGGSTAGRVLRAAALYLVLFAVVTALVSHLVGPSWSWAASLAGLAGIHPFMGWVGRRTVPQEAEGDESMTNV